MNRLTRISVLAILFLSPALCRAEKVAGAVHEFKDMFADGTLEASDDYTIGTTDFVTYTCTGTNAKFGALSKVAAIDLPAAGSTVTTTRIDDFCGFQLVHNPHNKSCENLKVYVSTDGEDFGEPLSGTAVSYSNGMVYVNIPPGDYYVRLANSSSLVVSVQKITFYQDHCPKCFEYKE